MHQAPRHTAQAALLPALALLLAAPSGPSQHVRQRSEHLADYTMEARLDHQRREVTGSQTITYRNRVGAPTRELRFHLYLNAFQPGSTHMRESGADFRARWRPDEYGGIEVRRLVLRDPGEDGDGAVDLTGTLRFEAPADGNPLDRTVAVARLPRPFQHGEDLVLETEFHARIPRAWRRTGWAPGDFFMMGHWFPKLGVLQRGPDGGARWNCHQFHAHSEFFADFGLYDVTLDVPETFVVGATGGLPVEERTEAGRRILRFRQGDVHDFAWVASPRLRVHRRRFSAVEHQDTGLITSHARAMGRENVEEMMLSDVEVILLLQAEHDTPALRERHFDATFMALAWYGSRYGRYPYETLTVVDPATAGLEMVSHGGGMEYPTLFTCGTPLLPHRRQMAPESVTIHEAGHQFWYLLSANNEFEEAWLDEGINTYSQARLMDELLEDRRPALVSRFGGIPMQGYRPFAGVLPGRQPDTQRPGRLLRLPLPEEPVLPEFTAALLHDVPLLRILREAPYFTYGREGRTSSLYGRRASYLVAPQADHMVRRAWEYMDSPSYWSNAYFRPTVLLATMERMLAQERGGEERWWIFLRRFAEQSRFGHPTTAEFLDLLESELGGGMRAFMERAMEPPGILDFGVESAESRRQESGEGFRSEVVVRSFGDLAAPVRVRFTFAGRPEPLELRWEDPHLYPWKRFVFEDGGKEGYGELLEVRVDPPLAGMAGPAGVYVMDANLLNNAWRKEGAPRPGLARALRSLLLVQSLFSFFGVFG